MNYNDLKNHCLGLKISVSSVAADCDLSLDGLRKGLNNESLAMKYIFPLCKSAGLSPSRLLGYNEVGDINYGAMNKDGKKQIINTNTEELRQAIEILRDQLKAKDEQLAKKDEQIASLIGKIA